MKFGKRLLAESARKWAPQYLDYKSIKRCLKADCLSLDPQSPRFGKAMASELEKVVIFYNECEARLAATLVRLEAMAPADAASPLVQLRLELQELTKYAVLNYMAVIKAVKKRNRRLRETCGPDAVTPLTALDLLQRQSFFTSKVLSQVATAATILEEKFNPCWPRAEIVQEYECAICLELLRSPVVLTCSHRFCWGCITTHCAGILHAHDAPAAATAVPAKAPPSLPPSPETATPSMRLRSVDVEQLHPDWETLLADVGLKDRQWTFDCPMCRRTQILDVGELAVDQNLSKFVEQLRTRRSLDAIAPAPPSPAGAATRQLACAPRRIPAAPHCAPPAPPPAPPAPAPVAQDVALLPPQRAQHAGKLVIVLDLDGTLVSSFPPRSAPRLPHYVRTHLVGKGSKLNPQGVFVVERPGLQPFLRAAAKLGELAIFTAGLQDYAQPIIDAIDPTGEFFADAVVYRDGTTAAPQYPCVKDLSRLGRPLSRTLLVDDTPLAFLWHPDSGVPVVAFRGDPDDNLLMDAVLPLLHKLDASPDIRPDLEQRFGMPAWFASHGYPARPPPSARSSTPARPHSASANGAAAGASAAGSGHGGARAFVAAELARNTRVPRATPLLLCDFDKTLVPWDAGERITEALAPELVPILAGLSSPANFVPTTNAVLAQMQQLGVSRDQLLRELNRLGADVPAAVVNMMRSARNANCATRILSDCNTVFIAQILEGAGCLDLVHDVITNESQFVSATAGSAHVSLAQPQSDAPPEAAAQPAHRLAVSPCQPEDRPHNCPICPASLCKGLYTSELQSYHLHIVFAGDGANDLCAVLQLRAEDTALVRANHPCHHLLVERSQQPDAAQPACTVRYWSTHEELAALAGAALGSGGALSGGAL